MLEGYTGRTKSARVWGVGGDCCRSRAACKVRLRRGGAHIRTDAQRRAWEQGRIIGRGLKNRRRLRDKSWARSEPERPRARAGPDSKAEARVGAKRAPGG